MRKITIAASIIAAFAVMAGCSSADPEAIGSAEGAIGSNSELNPFPRHFPLNGAVHEQAKSGGAGNLLYHNGPTMTVAHVVPIFWGSEWGTASAPSALARDIMAYIGQYGTNGEYNVITQYSGIQQSTLSNGSGVFDGSAPPTNVTDAAVQAEAAKYATDTSTIYEVFLPSTSYSSDGTSTSCGGTNLAYCAYHGNFAGSIGDVKYASMPYPSCSGCQTAGFTLAQNFEHFISHETREAVTDPDGTGWYDRRGYEADDKCAWSPAPFADSTTGTNSDGSGFAYQYEWSNATSSCVKTR